MCNDLRSHLYSPIWYLYQKNNVSSFQQLYDPIYMCSCCIWILFDVIQNKIVKHSIIFAAVQSWWWFFLVWSTNLFQFNDFNRNRSITTILFRLYLVWKTVYCTFWIILMSQYLVGNLTTIECLLVWIFTVIISKNVYMCQLCEAYYEPVLNKRLYTRKELVIMEA